MVPLKSVDRKPVELPPVSVLPSSDPDFLRAIDDVALLASGLIASTDAAMLTIAVPSDRWGADVPMVVWNQGLDGCRARVRTLTEEPMYGAAFDALCIAADALFSRLETWRWDDAAAPGLCLVTDGTGVVLSPERPPADANAGWLLDMVRSGNTTVARAPDADGPWSLITAKSGTVH